MLYIGFSPAGWLGFGFIGSKGRSYDLFGRGFSLRGGARRKRIAGHRWHA
jgi:hypothetical protein